MVRYLQRGERRAGKVIGRMPLAFKLSTTFILAQHQLTHILRVSDLAVQGPSVKQDCQYHCLSASSTEQPTIHNYSP